MDQADHPNHGPPDEPQGGHGHGPKPKEVEIEVNGKPVTVPDREVTSAEIKNAAIDQGVGIQPNFVLQQELSNGSSKVIGDGDTVRVHPGTRFTAIAPDDNS